MNRIIPFVLLTLLFTTACREKRQAAPPPFDPDRFVVEAIQIASSNADLGRFAAQRARTTQARQLGTELATGQQALRESLLQVARKRGIAVPAQLQERQLALRDNLSIMPGMVFDRGYSLAMTQELDRLARRFESAAATKDADFVPLASQVAALRSEKARAQSVLDSVGGSPFHVQ